MTLIKDILYGMAVGDALGVPYEFKSREEIKKNPCTDMIGFGTHNQPKGTWSDDTSLALATVDSLKGGYSVDRIAANFLYWRDAGFFAINKNVFDIGCTTNQAIERIKEHKLPITLCGGSDERSNGNGSLMRILPIVDYINYLGDVVKADISIEDRRRMIADLSSITHRHKIAIQSCQILCEFALYLIHNKNITDKKRLLSLAHNWIMQESRKFDMNTKLSDGLFLFPNEIIEDNVKSGGYVLDTLEASIWCLLTTDNYKDAVLKAVNLGSDTDTTACVTGGLAGILYGYDNIPKEWINDLQGKDLIDDVITNYEKSKI